MSRKISWDKVNLDNILLGEIKNGTFNAPGGGVGTYTAIAILYHYPAGIKPFLMEGPDECPVKGVYDGTKNNEESGEQAFTQEPNAKKRWAALMVFPRDNPVMMAFREVVHQVYLRIISLLAALKPKLPQALQFSSAEFYREFVRSPIRVPIDKKTKQVIDGDETMYWNFLDFRRMTPDYKYRNGDATEIYDLKKQMIPWEFLLPYRFTMKPLLRFDRIYLGAEKVVQVKLSSAFLTGPPESKDNVVNRQEDSIDEYIANKGEEKVKMLEESIEQAMISAADSLGYANPAGEAEAQEVSGPSYDGVAPIGDDPCEDYSHLTTIQ